MYGDLTLLAMAKKRMDWVARRQEVLARNIANANTPGYRPSDLKPLEFKELVRQPQAVTAAVTHPAHVATQPAAGGSGVEVQRRPSETVPDGNAVNLEEQMHKLGEAKGAYDLAANLFQKHVKLIKSALGRGGM